MTKDPVKDVMDRLEAGGMPNFEELHKVALKTLETMENDKEAPKEASHRMSKLMLELVLTYGEGIAMTALLSTLSNSLVTIRVTSDNEEFQRLIQAITFVLETNGMSATILDNR